MLLQCIFFVWLMVPTSFNGSIFLYNRLIRPYFLRTHGAIDDSLNRIRAQGIHYFLNFNVFHILLASEEFEGTWMFQIINWCFQMCICVFSMMKYILLCDYANVSCVKINICVFFCSFQATWKGELILAHHFFPIIALHIP